MRSISLLGNFTIIVGLFFILSCEVGDNGYGLETDKYSFKIDLADKKQTIKGFGASDAWSVQFVGKNWIDKREDIARLLFSTELNFDGNPYGIGLSSWRFNIGAGSSTDENITDEWRRTESFLNDDGSYNWTRQEGQRWFLQRAKQYGVKDFTAFVNSPPVTMTKNGKAYGDGGSSSNLKEGSEVEFSEFICDVLGYFKSSSEDQLDFLHVSPVNEPQWDWAAGNGQEGSPYSNSEIYSVVKALDDTILSRGLSTKIELPESAQLNFLYEIHDDRGNQMREFFYESSDYYLNKLSSVAGTVAGHSYFTTWPLNKMIETREKVGRLVDVYDGVEFTMSEYCLLEDNEEVAGTREVGGINPALYIARQIHFDLSLANASSWCWWLAVSPYNYNDGLVYITKNKTGGQYEDSKILWALGNYSLFIRPGYQRVSVETEDFSSSFDTVNSIMVSAYIGDNNKELVVVAVNYSNQDLLLDLEFINGNSIGAFTSYLTSEEYDLHKMDLIERETVIKIPKRSVLTLVGETDVSISGI